MALMFRWQGMQSCHVYLQVARRLKKKVKRTREKENNKKGFARPRMLTGGGQDGCNAAARAVGLAQNNRSSQSALGRKGYYSAVPL